MPKGRKTGGRQQGTPNKKTTDILELADDLNINPIEIMLRIAEGNYSELGCDKNDITTELRLNAASRVAPYLYPKRKPDEKYENRMTLEDLITLSRED